MLPTRQPCPKCGALQVREKRRSLNDPSLSILECEKCGHVWKPPSITPNPALEGQSCEKCGSARMRFVGRSPSGKLYFRCDACEHLLIEDDAPPPR